MIHGKWYRGCDDLNVLEREITEEDKVSWHLVIENGEARIGRCSLSPYKDSFCIRDVLGDSEEIELMLRMIGAKLEVFGKQKVYAKKDTGIKNFGFEEAEDDVLKAEKLILPIHCKG